MNAIKRIVLLIFGVVSCSAYADTKLVELGVRPGVTMKMMVIEPDRQPKGVLVLYAGGRGTIELGSLFGIPSINKYKANFLVRTRERFANDGYVVVLPDVPSDQDRLRYSYRLSDDQVADAAAIVEYFRSTYQLPIWLLGTSASSLGVAHAAASLSDKIDGIALTASVTRPRAQHAVYNEFPEGTASTELSAITVPVIIASNREDACDLSPSEDSELIRNRLVNSPRVEVHYFTGGSPPQSKPCNALSRHGFLGIEEEVVGEILSFIEG
jgi:hypothetical protein